MMSYTFLSDEIFFRPEMKNLDKDILLATAVASAAVLAVAALIQNMERPAVPGRVKRLAEALFNKAGGTWTASKSSSVHMPSVARPELREVGAENVNGEKQYFETRLYMQLRVLEVSPSTTVLQCIEDLKKNLSSIPCVLYLDASSSTAIGLLSWSEDPTMFASTLNQILGKMAKLNN
jgi:hypothetical protein